MRKPLAPNSLAVQLLVQLLHLHQLPMTVLRPPVSRRSFRGAKTTQVTVVKMERANTSDFALNRMINEVKDE